MKVEELPIAGALLVTPDVFGDERGYFKEIFSARRYAECLGDVTFVQDNVSKSVRGVLRGLHAAPGMAKLVQAIDGEIFDVIVDMRPASATFGQWHAETLRGDSHRQLYVPDGCLHGFLTTSETATILYKQTAYYNPAIEIGVAWDDPTLAIAWPSTPHVLLSAKDATNKPFPAPP